EKTSLRSGAKTSSPRHACSKRKTAAEAHACGAQATGYNVGASPGRRGKPQNSSGRRCKSKKMLASIIPASTMATDPLRSYLANPAAIKELSCGQIEPLWYDIGLYRASLLATVRIPHPEKDVSSVNVAATRRACSSVAIPAKRQCPPFDVRTLHGRLLPSKARAYVEMSSHQKISSNRRRKLLAWFFSSPAAVASPNSKTSSLAPSFPASTY